MSNYKNKTIKFLFLDEFCANRNEMIFFYSFVNFFITKKAFLYHADTLELNKIKIVFKIHIFEHFFKLCINSECKDSANPPNLYFLSFKTTPLKR